jgi:hypothetical protein
MRRNSGYATAALVAGIVATWPLAAIGAEGGQGFYLLGTKGPAAAITPPPGVFFSNDLYFYKGDVGGGLQLPAGGKLSADVEGAAVIELPTALWVLPEEVLGGHVGLSATLPVGWKETQASLSVAGPLGGVATGSRSDDVFTVGDPILGASLGWSAGNFHWQVGTLINVPVGDYQKGEISNIAFHHWGADVNAAVTWLDPAVGLDLSAALGMTFNAENPTTRYRTGNEFHFEWAAVQHFNEQFDAGLIGYHYSQVTGDSGAGASRDFKGRTTAVGATVGWSFKVGALPVSSRIKYYHEFSTRNRASGDAVFLNLTVPLAITPPASAQ